ARAAAGAAGAVAAGVDLVAVVLVVRHPVDVVEQTVVAAQRVVVVMPEALQALLFARQAGPMGEDVPPGLVAAVAGGAPFGACAAGDHQQPAEGEHETGKAF